MDPNGGSAAQIVRARKGCKYLVVAPDSIHHEVLHAKHVNQHFTRQLAEAGPAAEQG